MKTKRSECEVVGEGGGAYGMSVNAIVTVDRSGFTCQLTDAEFFPGGKKPMHLKEQRVIFHASCWL